MSAQGWGAVVGLAASAGLLSLLSWVTAGRPLRVAERIAPYIPGANGRIVGPPAGVWATVLMLVRPDAGRRGSVRSPDERALVRRLDAAGRAESPDQYRLEQVASCALGSACGLALGVWLVIGGTAPLAAVILAGVGGLAGWLARDRRLARQVRRRQDRIEQQLPTIAELLAFAVAAGESPMAALQRAAECTAGDMSDEVRRAVADIRGGIALEPALRGMAERAGAPSLHRFVEGIVVAMERGTPLADVMRAQAADARGAQQRRLMEVAGRKDVAMLVPVVFLILPTVVLIALYPGIQGLRLVVP